MNSKGFGSQQRQIVLLKYCISICIFSSEANNLNDNMLHKADPQFSANLSVLLMLGIYFHHQHWRPQQVA